jgi:chromosome segregation ATPase
MDRRDSILLESAGTEIAGVRRILAEAIEELRLAEERAEQLTEEIGEVRQSGETRIRDLEQGLSHAGGKIDLLQTRCAELEMEAGKAQANLVLHQQAARQAEQVAIKWEAQASALTEQVGSLLASLSNTKTEAAVKMEANNRLEAAYAELKEVLAQSRQRCAQVEAELAEANRRLAEVTAEKALAEQRALLSEQRLKLKPQRGKAPKPKPGTAKT